MSHAPHSILEQAGLASGLLSQEQIDQAWHTLIGPLNSGSRSLLDLSDETLSDRLIELGYLNRWQAEQLMQGRTKFTLGPYRILDAIGHGGMGYVFKCEHVLLGRIEAIKVLPKSQMGPASIAAFCREIRAQAQLDHPNLVRLTFADKDGETYYLVTEFVPGADLRRLVRHHGPLNEQQAAVVISQAAEALAYAHHRGLVHRDVKPGNLLVTPDGHTKLTDLGLASFYSDAAPADDGGPRHIVGTPDFLAPEAITTPGSVRPVSDIYSLGCTLYYAVTGKVPFPGGITGEKLRRHLDETPITPTRFTPQLTHDFVDVIADMMHKRAESRLATADEVVRRLRPWTQAADAKTWEQIGKYAAAPGEPSLSHPAPADTLPVHSDGVDMSSPPPAPTPPAAALASTSPTTPVAGAAATPPAATAEHAATPRAKSDTVREAGPMAVDSPPSAPAEPFQIAGLGLGPLLLISAAVLTAVSTLAVVLISLVD